MTVIIEHRKTRRGQPKSRGRVFVLGCSRWSGHSGVKVSVRDCRITSLTLDLEETTVAEGWSLEWRPWCEGVGPRKFRQDVTSIVELGETPESRFAPDGRFSCAEDVGRRASAAWDAVGRWRFTIAASYSFVGVMWCIGGDRARLN
jgi:hypothetical protein